MKRAEGVARLVIGLALLLPGSDVASQPRIEAVAKGLETGGFGRIELTFPEPSTISARIAGSVLVVEFERPVKISTEKLPPALPGYLAAARADPDERSIRFALTRPVRIDVKEAAEKVFVDLLPETWRGPPPPLPAEVVRDLARRAREAQMLVAAAEQRVARQNRPFVLLRVAEMDGRTRLAFETQAADAARVVQKGRDLAIQFPANVRLSETEARARLASVGTGVRIEDGESSTTLFLTLTDEAQAKAEVEDGHLLVDLERPAAAKPAAPAPAAKPAPAVAPRPEESLARRTESKAAEAPPAEATQPPAEPAPAPAAMAGAPAEAAVRVSIQPAPAGVQVLLSPRTPMAVIERDGAIWAIVQGARSVRLPAAGGPERALVEDIDAEHHDRATLVRILPKATGLVSVAATAEGWRIDIGGAVEAAPEPIRLVRSTGADGRRLLKAGLPQAGEPVTLDDPATGGKLIIVPMLGAPHAMLTAQHFAEVSLPRSALGFAVLARAEDVFVRSELDSASIGRESGLNLSQDQRAGAQAARTGGQELVVVSQQWADDRRGAARETGRALLRAAADAPKRDKTAARIRYAQFLLANGLGVEAGGVLGLTAADDPGASQSKTLLMLRGIAAIQNGDFSEAGKLLSQPALSLEPEAMLWRAYADVQNRRYGPALTAFRQTVDILDRYPDQAQAMLRPAVAHAALEGGDLYLASQQAGELERLDAADRDPGLVQLLQGRIAEAAGRLDEALSGYGAAAKTATRPFEAEARLHLALLQLRERPAEHERIKAELETIAMIWRRGEVEVRARAKLSELYAGEQRWRDAFAMTKRAVEIQPEHPLTRKLQDDTAQRFAALFLEGHADKLSRIEALAIFNEFRSLIPVGARGDEIVRRLADRLYDLDLLEQAAELLDHQVTHRLKGVARSQTAARLAVVHLVNGKPQEALKVLKATRLANLPGALRRSRVILEARTLAELARTELAMETLAAETGPDVERLRADILWRGKRWGEAAETYERALGDRWREETPLEDGERGDAVRAGVAYVLAGDRLGLDRLRTKFLPKMADSPDGETFKLVTLDNISRAKDFREVARGVVSAQTLGDFLEAYRKRYPEAAGGKRAPTG